MGFWRHQAQARTGTRRLLPLFALCVLLVLGAVHGGLALAWWVIPGDWPFPRGFVAVNVGVTLLLIVGGWWLEHSQLRAGGVKLAQRIGARPAQPSSHWAERQLCHIVEEMCVAAQMAPPQVMVLPRSEAINAFAAGWDAQDAILAVTQGALDFLQRDEMQGLVAHELSHLKEGDTRLNMQLAGMVAGLELVYGFGQQLRERGGVLGGWFGAVVMAAGWVGWLSGQALKAAVARQREWLADARALQWTRQPESLGRVLRKVLAQRLEAQTWRQGWGAGEARRAMGLHHPLVQHMLLAEVADSGRIAHWLDAHPPLEQRIARIYGRRMRALPVTDGLVARHHYTVM